MSKSVQLTEIRFQKRNRSTYGTGQERRSRRGKEEKVAEFANRLSELEVLWKKEKNMMRKNFKRYDGNSKYH